MKCPVQICECVFVPKATLAVVCLLRTTFGFGNTGTPDSKLHMKWTQHNRILTDLPLNNSKSIVSHLCKHLH